MTSKEGNPEFSKSNPPPGFLVSVHFGSFTQPVKIPTVLEEEGDVEFRLVNPLESRDGLVQVEMPNDVMMWVQPNILSEEGWETERNKSCSVATLSLFWNDNYPIRNAILRARKQKKRHRPNNKKKPITRKRLVNQRRLSPQ